MKASLFLLGLYLAYFTIYEYRDIKLKDQRPIKGSQRLTLTFYFVHYIITALYLGKPISNLAILFLSVIFIFATVRFICYIAPQINNIVFNEETLELAIKNYYVYKNSMLKIQASDCLVSKYNRDQTMCSTRFAPCCICLSEESCYYLYACNHVAIGHNCLLLGFEVGRNLAHVAEYNPSVLWELGELANLSFRTACTGMKILMK